MTAFIDIDWLAQNIDDHSTKGIALTTITLIREGKIEVGSQLPSVRSLAEKLGVSPATVSAAWSYLKRQNVISGQGRSGVRVCTDQVSPRPSRFERAQSHENRIQYDLATSSPDPALLPDLKIAIVMGSDSSNLNSYNREKIIPNLLDTIKKRWPFPAEDYLTTNGGFDAMDLIIHTLVAPGDKVLIEDPSASRLLDMLDHAGAIVYPVACDESGPLPDALNRMLAQNPVMFIYQPRTHSVTGNTVTEFRSKKIADVLANSKTIIVEDDGIGDLSRYPVWSQGRFYPSRTLYVRSFSKAYGPDLRLAVLSGPQSLIRSVQSYRHFGTSWTSRLLQGAAAWMMEDDKTQDSITLARKTYRQRRQLLVDALSRRGISVPSYDGMSAYITVLSEEYAMHVLTQHGIRAMYGQDCSLAMKPFIRVSTNLITSSNVGFIADAIREAASRDFSVEEKQQKIQASNTV